MSTGLGSKRWLGVTLLIALFCLFTVADLQAKDARSMDIAPIGTCDFGELGADPWMVGAEPVAPCPGYELSEVQSVYLIGDYGLMRVVVGDEVESHVYQRIGTEWKRIHVLSTDYGELDYLIELENAWMELDNAQSAGQNDIGSAPRPAIRPSDSIGAVEYEMTGNELGLDSAGGTGLKRFEFVSPGEGALAYLFERESADHAQDVGFAPRPIIRSSDDSSAVEYEMTGNELQLDGEGGMDWESIQFAPTGDAYLEYLFELESNETDP